MERCFHAFLTVFLVHANFASGHVHYITPSHNLSCPQQPCFTLSELAADSNLSRTTNVTLLLLPGNHHLNHELVISDANNVSVTKLGGSVFVRCTSQSGRFKISRTTTVSIKGLHFMGCGGNLVTQVNRLTIEDTIFQGIEGSGTALVLNGTVEANIVTCSYFCNTIGSTIQGFEVSTFDMSETRTAGGAIIATQSNALIYNTIFEGNSAHFGTSIYVGKRSNVSINNSQFFNEASTSGSSGFGVLFVDQDCSVQVSNSTFNNNKAGYGVISSFGGTVVINNDTIFVSNTALVYGGAVFVYNGSLYVNHSTFLNNTAGNGGGVIGAYGGSCFIADSTFSSNIAHFIGGVIYAMTIKHFLPSNTSGGTDTAVGSFYIAGSTFSNNAAEVGGVMYTINSSVCVTDSSFHNNTAVTAGGVLYIFESVFLIANTTFNSSAASLGGIAHSYDSQMTIIDCNFEKTTTSMLGAMYLFLTSINFSGNTDFVDNLGSVYAFSCNVTFNGSTRFENGMVNSDDVQFVQESGAITSILSNVHLAGTSNLINNQGMLGGAILAIESMISISGDLSLIHI